MNLNLVHENCGRFLQYVAHNEMCNGFCRVYIANYVHIA